MLDVFKHVLPNLPIEEKYDLVDQLRRSAKAIPRLIAEGHSKRHQKKGFQRYLDDAMTESNLPNVSPGRNRMTNNETSRATATDRRMTGVWFVS